MTAGSEDVPDGEAFSIDGNPFSTVGEGDSVEDKEI